MRYGGDEFVIFGGYRDGEEKKVDLLLESIRNDFKEVNESGKHPFILSASMGVSIWKAKDITNLDDVIEMADQQMYQESVQKNSQQQKLQRRVTNKNV